MTIGFSKVTSIELNPGEMACALRDYVAKRGHTKFAERAVVKFEVSSKGEYAEDGEYEVTAATLTLSENDASAPARTNEGEQQ